MMIVGLCVCLSWLSLLSSSEQLQTYSESLHVEHMRNGDVHLHFNHTMTMKPCLLCTHSNDGGLLYDKFPKSIGELVIAHKIEELHLRLTQGIWRYESLGYPRTPQVAPGADLMMWLHGNVSNPLEEWQIAINSLAGMFCASLNFMTGAFSSSPVNTFEPWGVIDGNSNSSHFMYSNLPGENVCTENLTPWKKLLPCSSTSGISNLLYANQLFNARYTSIGVDIFTVASDDKHHTLSTILQLSVDVVFDNFRIKGDSKPVSLMSLFHQPLGAPCEVSSRSDIVAHDNEYFNSNLIVRGSTTKEKSFNLLNASLLDVILAKSSYESNTIQPVPLEMILRKYAASSRGVGEDSIVSEIVNMRDMPVEVKFFDLIPWHFRVLLHTLAVATHNGDSVTPSFMHYVPSIDRVRPSALELTLEIPAKSTVSISFKMIKVTLDWTEHPPDPHHGHFAGPSVVLYSDKRLYSEPLIIQLMVPDFSMPYNVLCLSCTILTVGYSAAQTLVTRRYMFVENVTMKQKIKTKLLTVKAKLLSIFLRR